MHWNRNSSKYPLSCQPCEHLNYYLAKNKNTLLQLLLPFFFRHLLLLAQQVRLIFCINCLALRKIVIKIHSLLKKKRKKILNFPADFYDFNFFDHKEYVTTAWPVVWSTDHSGLMMFHQKWQVVLENYHQISETATKSTCRWLLAIISWWRNCPSLKCLSYRLWWLIFFIGPSQTEFAKILLGKKNHMNGIKSSSLTFLSSYHRSLMISVFQSFHLFLEITDYIQIFSTFCFFI